MTDTPRSDNASMLSVELAHAIHRREIALWLGPDWSMPREHDAKRQLTSAPWLAVWSVPTDSELADALQSAEASGAETDRTLIEVPDDVTDALGPSVSYAKFFPYFYMNGKGAGWVRKRRGFIEQATAEKRSALRGLGGSTLIVAGYQDGAALADLLTNDVLDRAPELRVVVTGLPAEQWSALIVNLAAEFRQNVRVDEQDLAAALVAANRVRTVWTVDVSEPEIQIGSTRVLLQPLLQNTPPIDQEFHLLTVADWQPPRPDENPDVLLTELLRGRHVSWRAFAHGLDWKRPFSHAGVVLERLRELATAPRNSVEHLELEAEHGSGVTTVLQQVAFEAARHGFPALLHRTDHTKVSYDLLRAFLSDLRQNEQIPILLLFDLNMAESSEASRVDEVRERLQRDGIRAVIVAAAESASQVADLRTSRAHRNGRASATSVRRLDSPLRAVLSVEEQDSLLKWARNRDPELSDAQINLIRRWSSEHAGDAAPLLIWLYAILRGELRGAAQLGRHLANRIDRLIVEQAARDADAPGTSDEILQGGALEQALQRLRCAWAAMQTTRQRPPQSLYRGAVAALAALGTLKISVPRSVLRDLLAAGPHLDEVLSDLERIDLVTLEVATDADTDARSHLSPRAFYTLPESVSLRHAAYGRLLLEYYVAEPAGAGKGPLVDEVLAETPSEIADSADAGLPPFPLRLLRPLLLRLRPRPDHIEFAEHVSLQYLRLQREYGDGFGETSRSRLAAWQFENPQHVAEAYRWVQEPIIEQSDVLLHGRGMLYKGMLQAPTVDVRVARGWYEQAEADFQSAVEIAKSVRAKEHYVNPLTSLGLMYVSWARAERDAGGGRLGEIDRKARDTLAECLEARQHNPFAAYGLARYYVETCERDAGQPVGTDGERDGDYVERLTRAIELLQMTPEARFADRWNDMLKRAVRLLSGQRAANVITRLQASGDRMGYALEALRMLEGLIPTLDGASLPATALLDVLKLLDDAAARFPDSKSALADLLSYAAFSALAEQEESPAFAERYERIKRIRDTFYGRQPVWTFDAAVLAMQTGRYGEGEAIFDSLRRGRRFFDVPLERSTMLTAGADTTRVKNTSIKVTALEHNGTRGWGRVENLREPVPFDARDFVSRGWPPPRVGAVMSCQLRLRPTGPIAVPAPRRAVAPPASPPSLGPTSDTARI